MALLGTETEYGILAPDAVRDVGRPADPEWLSALVVDAYAGAATPALAEVHNRVLGNGARLERINVGGNLSARGLRESHGVMVNYRYDLDDIEPNHEAFATRNTVVASGSVRKLLRPAG